jgi:hypothetical protein
MITRQHEETEIPELTGATCHAALAAGMSIEEGVTALFLRVGDVWYRIYIDVGVLFWQPGEPDPDVELAEDEQFIDLFKRIGASSMVVERIHMHSGELKLEFADSHSIVLTEQQETGLLDVKVQ